ncbi:hypothetical protein E1262_15510 [Jiangella aurantiaca]|uniref:Sigma-70 family RNA polymerase sigma factor n=2 Tax=Jiangella aurantiaca TaxID=2530373 RepID=A0A4R5AFB4_9ACTN|nr:hypothetical protein E1262_15510 [Jiangella aurantiaca]
MSARCRPEDSGVTATGDAFERQALTLLPCVYSTALILTGDRGAAEDLALRGYWLATDRFRTRATHGLRTRLLQAVVDVSGWVFQGAAEAAAAVDPTTMRLVDSPTPDHVSAAVAALPPGLRLPIWLADHERVPRAQLAQILRVPPNALPAVLRAARMLLLRRLTTAVSRRP